MNIYWQRWAERNPDRALSMAREGSKRYRERHPDRVTASLERYRKSGNGKRKLADRSRRLKYGITPSQYDELVKISGGYCSLCMTQSTPTGVRELVVEHCHSTGRVRGLVCHPCNRMLAHMEHYGLNHEWLVRAEGYIS